MDRILPATYGSTLVVAQLLHAFNLEANARRQIFGPVGLAVTGSLMAHVVILHVGFTQEVFSIAPLGAVEWLYALGAAVIGFLGARLTRQWLGDTED